MLGEDFLLGGGGGLSADSAQNVSAPYENPRPPQCPLTGNILATPLVRGLEMTEWLQQKCEAQIVGRRFRTVMTACGLECTCGTTFHVKYQIIQSEKLHKKCFYSSFIYLSHSSTTLLLKKDSEIHIYTIHKSFHKYCTLSVIPLFWTRQLSTFKEQNRDKCTFCVYKKKRHRN